MLLPACNFHVHMRAPPLAVSCSFHWCSQNLVIQTVAQGTEESTAVNVCGVRLTLLVEVLTSGGRGYRRAIKWIRARKCKLFTKIEVRFEIEFCFSQTRWHFSLKLSKAPFSRLHCLIFSKNKKIPITSSFISLALFAAHSFRTALFFFNVAVSW